VSFLGLLLGKRQSISECLAPPPLGHEVHEVRDATLDRLQLRLLQPDALGGGGEHPAHLGLDLLEDVAQALGVSDSLPHGLEDDPLRQSVASS